MQHEYKSYFFFFNDTATTEIYTLSLHDALPISPDRARPALRTGASRRAPAQAWPASGVAASRCGSDRKSTRLNSSHSQISYAVFCLKKKKKQAVIQPYSINISAMHASSNQRCQ